MYSQDTNPSSSLLIHTPAPGSPGSSVFDLPIQSSGPTTARPKPPAIHTQALDRCPQEDTPKFKHSYVVISGGTGGNAICASNLSPRWT